MPSVLEVLNMPYRKRIPYGMMDFVSVRENDCYYVDKTHYIPLIERANKFFFFNRPPWFGKSLTLSTLRHYYDVNEADKFEKWYGDLYIGKNPTPERNSYLVIYLNFAAINGEVGNYRKSLDAHCNTEFNIFCDTYADYLPAGTKEEMNKKNGAVGQLDYLCAQCTKAGQKIYLFIDEYDHFAHQILAQPDCLDNYKNQASYLHNFFDTVKAGTASVIKRCFMTGISPVTMDDLTSGFNIGTNYSLSPLFNEMVGFTEAEVREMLAYYSSVCEFHHTIDELIEIMKPWYNNYCFAGKSCGETTIYNSNMALYFIGNYVNSGGKLPNNMIEENVYVDYNKLRMLIHKDKEFAHDASAIQTLVQQGFITGNLKTGFPAESITDSDNFLSLLFYFGMITISGMHEGETKLTIPNQVVREQLFNYLLANYNDADLRFDNYEKDKLASRLAYRGEWKPYFEYIADCLHRYAFQRDKQKGEFFVHGFTLAMTAQNRFYRPVSEKDTQEGYVDLFLHPLLDIYKDMLHSYVIELKYAKGKDCEERVEQLRREAIAQAERYAASKTVQHAVGTTTLHKIVVVYRGMEMVVCEEI